MGLNGNGMYTLPDTETDKLAYNPMGMFVSVCLCAVWTSHNSI